MTISGKGKRRLVVGDRAYVWYVGPDENAGDQPALTVVSGDRSVFLRYQLQQSDDVRHVVVIGPEFRSIQCGGRWRRFRCPAFGRPDSVTPADVRALLEWALAPELPPEEVDWRGQPILPEAT